MSHRFETNEQIIKCLNACDKYNLKYSLDHIFGLPNETEKEQLEAAKLYSNLKSIVKMNCFYMTIFPRTDMVEKAKEAGLINEKDVKKQN